MLPCSANVNVVWSVILYPLSSLHFSSLDETATATLHCLWHHHHHRRRWFAFICVFLLCLVHIFARDKQSIGCCSVVFIFWTGSHALLFFFPCNIFRSYFSILVIWLWFYSCTKQLNVFFLCFTISVQYSHRQQNNNFDETFYLNERIAQ